MGSTLLFLTLLAPFAINQLPSHPIFKLWPKGNPDGWHRKDQEVTEYVTESKFLLVKQVSEPTLEFFFAKGARPDAPTVIVCPGGGYYVEAIEHEGWEIAQRLNLAGIHAAVLKYRLPNRDEDKPLHKVVIQDTQRAIRLLRSKAPGLGISSNHIGMLGFSAGGHAAAVTSTSHGATYTSVDGADKLKARPDFTALIYPAYINRPDTLDLAPEITVDSDTPPAFIVQTMDDPLQIEGALAYTHNCHLAKVAVELHLFAHGGHGYGLRTQEPGLDDWPNLLITWLKRSK